MTGNRIRICAFVAIAVLLSAQVLPIRTANAQDAGALAAALNEAEARLADARGGRAQRRALGQAIRAYEGAMRALRADIGVVSAKIRVRERALGAGAADVRRLTGALARLGGAAEPIVLTGAADPADGARAALVLRRLSATAARQSRNQLWCWLM